MLTKAKHEICMRILIKFDRQPINENSGSHSGSRPINLEGNKLLEKPGVIDRGGGGGGHVATSVAALAPGPFDPSTTTTSRRMNDGRRRLIARAYRV